MDAAESIAPICADAPTMIPSWLSLLTLAFNARGQMTHAFHLSLPAVFSGYRSTSPQAGHRRPRSPPPMQMSYRGRSPPSDIPPWKRQEEYASHDDVYLNGNAHHEREREPLFASESKRRRLDPYDEDRGRQPPSKRPSPHANGLRHSPLPAENHRYADDPRGRPEMYGATPTNGAGQPTTPLAPTAPPDPAVAAAYGRRRVRDSNHGGNFDETPTSPMKMRDGNPPELAGGSKLPPSGPAMRSGRPFSLMLPSQSAPSIHIIDRELPRAPRAMNKLRADTYRPDEEVAPTRWSRPEEHDQPRRTGSDFARPPAPVADRHVPEVLAREFGPAHPERLAALAHDLAAGRAGPLSANGMTSHAQNPSFHVRGQGTFEARPAGSRPTRFGPSLPRIQTSPHEDLYQRPYTNGGLLPDKLNGRERPTPSPRESGRDNNREWDTPYTSGPEPASYDARELAYRSRSPLTTSSSPVDGRRVAHVAQDRPDPQSEHDVTRNIRHPPYPSEKTISSYDLDNSMSGLTQGQMNPLPEARGLEIDEHRTERQSPHTPGSARFGSDQLPPTSPQTPRVRQNYFDPPPYLGQMEMPQPPAIAYTDYQPPLSPNHPRVPNTPQVSEHTYELSRNTRHPPSNEKEAGRRKFIRLVRRELPPVEFASKHFANGGVAPEDKETQQSEQKDFAADTPIATASLLRRISSPPRPDPEYNELSRSLHLRLDANPAEASKIATDEGQRLRKRGRNGRSEWTGR